MTDLNTIPTFCNGYRFQWEQAQDCYVLLYPEGMVKLNGSAGEILALVDNQRSTQDIVDNLRTKFGDVDTIEQDVMTFMQEAVANNWIKFD